MRFWVTSKFVSMPSWLLFCLTFRPFILVYFVVIFIISLALSFSIDPIKLPSIVAVSFHHLMLTVYFFWLGSAMVELENKRVEKNRILVPCFFIGLVIVFGGLLIASSLLPRVYLHSLSSYQVIMNNLRSIFFGDHFFTSLGVLLVLHLVTVTLLARVYQNVVLKNSKISNTISTTLKIIVFPIGLWSLQYKIKEYFRQQSIIHETSD